MNRYTSNKDFIMFLKQVLDNYYISPRLRRDLEFTLKKLEGGLKW